MFVEAINKVNTFTRPIRYISRFYSSHTIIPGTATLFFVNENGYALTCCHVAKEIIQADQLNRNYDEFKKELSEIKKDGRFTAERKHAERRHGLSPDLTAQLKIRFDGISEFNSCHIVMSEQYDLALIHFDCNPAILTDYAVFLKDSSFIQPGKMLCRLGYPFPEFSDYTYDSKSDDIVWTEEGNKATPFFPIEGMMTRYIGDISGNISGIEMSTPGLRGQSGGPLFDKNGVVYGMQSMTNHLHLGFDMKKEKKIINGREEIINNQPFLHVGQCIHVDIIKDFLNLHKVKYYVGDSYQRKEMING